MLAVVFLDIGVGFFHGVEMVVAVEEFARAFKDNDTFLHLLLVILKKKRIIKV